MRSSLLLLLLVGCATPDQVKQCYPATSWSQPTFRCESVAVAPEPEPTPEPVPVVEPEPPPVAEIKEAKIELREKVQFELDRAELLPQSKTVLDEVATILKEHPEIEKIRIEGHTDSDSSDSHNLKLSKKRAAAVLTYLASQGVEKSRMESEGFGETRPLADNSTDAGKEENRRVEIYIVNQK